MIALQRTWKMKYFFRRRARGSEVMIGYEGLYLNLKFVMFSWLSRPEIGVLWFSRKKSVGWPIEALYCVLWAVIWKFEIYCVRVLNYWLAPPVELRVLPHFARPLLSSADLADQSYRIPDSRMWNFKLQQGYFARSVLLLSEMWRSLAHFLKLISS